MDAVRLCVIGCLLLLTGDGAFGQTPTPTVPAPRPDPAVPPGRPATVPLPSPTAPPRPIVPANPPAPASPNPANVPAPSPLAPPVDFANAAPRPAAADVFANLGAERLGGFGDLDNLDPMLNMIGDQGPLPYLARLRARPALTGVPAPLPPPNLPAAPNPRQASALVASVRGFKISENQSPQPQDRVYFSFNYFADVNGTLNRRFESPIGNLQVYREVFGFEKTFNEGMGSIGMRVPLNTLSADSTIAGNYKRPGGTSTALGDLTICGKYVFMLDRESGSLLAAGVAITPPTGPDSFAGFKYLASIHSTTIQPWVGYIWRRGDFFLHGFTAMDVPSSALDVTMIYNDLGIGYYLFRNPDPGAFVSALIPTFEAHVNSPLNHRDYLNQNDLAAVPDVVNLTAGINMIVRQNSTLTFGFVTPVTGPRPFDYEALLLLNVRFGRSRGARAPLPMLGG